MYFHNSRFIYVWIAIANVRVDARRISTQDHIIARSREKRQGMPAVAPEFTVDLRKPPEERWSEVVAYFREPMSRVFRQMTEEMLPALGSAGTFFMDPLTALNFPEHIKSEICSIAREVGVQCNHLKIIQLAYELNAACTSIGAVFPGGAKLFRTMDWELSLLQELSATFHFVGDDFKYSASSWAGYVGVLTGVRAASSKSDGLAISVNFRRRTNSPLSHGVVWGKVFGMVTGAETVGFLLRRVLGGRAFASHRAAVEELSERRLAAPVYFTVVGVRPALQDLLDSYADAYEANYDPFKLMCCCSERQENCALVLKSSFIRGGCPELVFDKSGKSISTSENHKGCLSNPTLIAPCTTHPTEITIITRDVGNPEEVRTLTSTKKDNSCMPAESENEFLVQTNHDQFAPIVNGVPVSPDGANQDIFSSLARKRKAEKYLAGGKLEKLNPDNVTEYAFNVLSLSTIMNSHTVYGTVMDPRTGKLETRLPGLCYHVKNGKRKKHPVCGDSHKTFAFEGVRV